MIEQLWEALSVADGAWEPQEAQSVADGRKNVPTKAKPIKAFMPGLVNPYLTTFFAFFSTLSTLSLTTRCEREGC